jgi:hypothetical protein
MTGAGLDTMESEGIHRVIVPATPLNAFAIVVMTVALMLEWPWLRWIAAASLGLGFVAAGALIVLRRRSKGGPPAARLNFPPDIR